MERFFTQWGKSPPADGGQVSATGCGFSDYRNLLAGGDVVAPGEFFENRYAEDFGEQFRG
jgi:hypothetical protein